MVFKNESWVNVGVLSFGDVSKILWECSISWDLVDYSDLVFFLRKKLDRVCFIWLVWEYLFKV